MERTVIPAANGDVKLMLNERKRRRKRSLREGKRTRQQGGRFFKQRRPPQILEEAPQALPPENNRSEHEHETRNDGASTGDQSSKEHEGYDSV